jgi:hypothetical protein
VSAVAKLGMTVGARTMRRVLGRVGACWRRGQLVAKGDPERPAALARLAEELAAAELAAKQAGRRLLTCFEDEADLALLPHAGSSWQLRDHPATIPTPGQNRSTGLFGSLGLDGALVISEAARKTAVAFTRHLDGVVTRFPDREVAVIMDNAGIHHANVTVAWFMDHPQCHRLFLPRYRPNDNAQERMWNWLRADVCRNRAFPDLPSKLAAALAFFAALEELAIGKRCVPELLLARLLAESAGDSCQRT